ncbi:TLD-domain-containing protein [Hesseltinella vesiculosa]|uniref:Oxidation resistance protein 1 n=1 Tax=Hesseltinella vesiculosa TaxID=101127 RepID=A0A1X2GF94_9FUNG|nr:TLD-domain-containing protein [Hesseltinella vesiculosa]
MISSTRRPPFVRSTSLTTSLVDVTTAECKEFIASPTQLHQPLTVTTTVPTTNIPPNHLYRRLSHTLSRQGYSWDSGDFCSLTYSSDEEDDDTDTLLDTPTTLFFHERSQQTHPILDLTLAQQIRAWLPRRFGQLSNWTLLYSLDQHGASLSTLYQLLSQKQPCIFVFQDEFDCVFGAFVSEPIHPSNSFYGSGESFLWKASNGTCQHYPWTMNNCYFVYTDKDMLAFGSGQGTFGICLDADLLNGTSTSCPTFNNPCLASHSPFECLGLEVWTIT